jgi:hypothetical protein
MQACAAAESTLRREAQRLAGRTIRVMDAWGNDYGSALPSLRADAGRSAALGVLQVSSEKGVNRVCRS